MVTKKKTRAVAHEPPSLEEQADSKLREIRAQRREVKRLELEYGIACEAKKQAREALDTAIADLCKIIDGSNQGELFVGHVDTETGELEGDELAVNGADISRSSKKAGRTASALASARKADAERDAARASGKPEED